MQIQPERCMQSSSTKCTCELVTTRLMTSTVGSHWTQECCRYARARHFGATKQVKTNSTVKHLVAFVGSWMS